MISPESALQTESRTGFRIPHTPKAGSALEQAMARTWGTPGDPWQEGQCRVCSQPLAPNPVETHGIRVAVTVCDSCAPSVDEHYASASQDDDLWRSRCPERYREAVLRQFLPEQSSQPYRQAAQYQCTAGIGLILRGDSGTGKTVCLWEIARRLDMAGKPWEFRTGVQLGRELAKASREMELEPTLSRIPYLLIDDLGKEKLTASVAAALWELVEYRSSRQLPIIATTRYAGDGLVKRFAEPELGQDIAGRLRESCTAVLFRPTIVTKSELEKSA
jgi:DNA replication protein DnaC